MKRYRKYSSSGPTPLEAFNLSVVVASVILFVAAFLRGCGPDVELPEDSAPPSAALFPASVEL